MPLATCDRCGKMYAKEGDGAVCSKCHPDEQHDFETIRDALAHNPSLTADQLAEETGVLMECVMRCIDSGRVQCVTPGILGVKCGKCGAPAISLSKRLCETCLNKLNQDLAKEQSKIALPKRKEVEVGTALNASDTSVRRARSLDFRNR